MLKKHCPNPSLHEAYIYYFPFKYFTGTKGFSYIYCDFVLHKVINGVNEYKKSKLPKSRYQQTWATIYFHPGIFTEPYSVLMSTDLQINPCISSSSLGDLADKTVTIQQLYIIFSIMFIYYACDKLPT